MRPDRAALRLRDIGQRHRRLANRLRGGLRFGLGRGRRRVSSHRFMWNIRLMETELARNLTASRGSVSGPEA